MTSWISETFINQIWKFMFKYHFSIFLGTKTFIFLRKE
jgi:hypothetical protein